MDRKMIYPGQIPLETDLLDTNRFALIGLGKLAAAVLGTTTLVNGLACTPTAPASMQVQVAAGEIYSLQNLDGTAYSSLDADTTHSLLKQGLLMDAVNLTCPAPATSGQSVNYLVQAIYQDIDAQPLTLPYYNASNPTQAYSGPAGSGTAQNTVRKGICTVSVKAGIAATTGSQQTPAPDVGYVGLYSVTVAYGQTSITAGNIAAVSGAPILSETLLNKISQATGDARYATQTGFQQNAYSVANAGGTADAITGSYTPGISALTNGMTLCIRAGSANATTTPTFTPNSGVIAAATIVKGNNLPLAVGDIAGAGHWLELAWDSTLSKWVLLNPATGVTAKSSKQIQTVGASVAANAMTVTLNPTSLDFRSATANSGTVNTRTVDSQLSLTIPSTATLGTVSGVASRILILALDNAGTMELAVSNAAGGANLDETGVINTTAIAAGSNSATAIYSQTARTGVPYRIVGYVDSTQATAGTWTASPSAVQGIGGQALAAMSSIGYGQAWQNLTGSKAASTTYYNTTGKPIFVNIATNATWSGSRSLTVNGAVVDTMNCASTVNIELWVRAIVPPGASYSFNGTFTTWMEFR